MFMFVADFKFKPVSVPPPLAAAMEETPRVSVDSSCTAVDREDFIDCAVAGSAEKGPVPAGVALEERGESGKVLKPRVDLGMDGPSATSPLVLMGADGSDETPYTSYQRRLTGKSAITPNGRGHDRPRHFADRQSREGWWWCGCGRAVQTGDCCPNCGGSSGTELFSPSGSSPGETSDEDGVIRERKGFPKSLGLTAKAKPSPKMADPWSPDPAPESMEASWCEGGCAFGTGAIFCRMCGKKRHRENP
jgi:hypothetical protein